MNRSATTSRATGIHSFWQIGLWALGAVLMVSLAMLSPTAAQAHTCGPDLIVIELITNTPPAYYVITGNELASFNVTENTHPEVATIEPLEIPQAINGVFTITAVSVGDTDITIVWAGIPTPDNPFPTSGICSFIVAVNETSYLCPILSSLEGDPQEETKLGVLYDFRDEVLASTPTGQRYIELYYKHAEEGVRLMFSYPELLSHTQTLLEEFLPTLQVIVDGSEVTVTAADLADIEALLEAFAEKASPELQADIRAIQEELRQGTLLEQFGIRYRP